MKIIQKRIKRKRVFHEAKEQAHLISWAKQAYFLDSNGLKRKLADYLFAIPNGGSRHALEAANLKAQGVKAGVSDLFLPVPTAEHAGMWIEMKAAGGKATEAQKDWMLKMEGQGYCVGLCFGWTDAAKKIANYVGGVQTKSGLPLRLM